MTATKATKYNKLKLSLRIEVQLLIASIALIVLINSKILQANASNLQNNLNSFNKPGSTIGELIRARGYRAREYYFITKDGYILHIVRGTNPLINKGARGLRNKFPILLLHGATISGASFLIRSAKVKPKNFSRLKSHQMSLDELIKRVSRDPSSHSLPFLAMNFGYEVWILDRRGYMKSRHKVGHLKRTALDALKAIPFTLFGNLISGFSLIGGMIPGRPHKVGAKGHHRRSSRASDFLVSLINNYLLPKLRSRAGGSPEDRLLNAIKPLINFPISTMSRELLIEEAIKTFDPEYWNFSYDEQIEYDFPAAIDFVLAKSGQSKLHLVTLSASGAISILGLANKPHLAKKIGKAVHWAPAVTLGSETDIVYLLGYISPFLQGYIGPMPPTFATIPIETMMQNYCANDEMGGRNLCHRILDLAFGFSGRQAPMTYNLWANGMQAVSTNEMMQLGQFARTKRPCKFNFNTPQKNLEVYNSREVPCYNLSRVSLENMSFYVGKYDRLVSWADVNITISQLKVPTKLTVIQDRGVYFNHLGFLLHSRTNKLAIVPSLYDIELGQHQENQLKEMKMKMKMTMMKKTKTNTNTKTTNGKEMKQKKKSDKKKSKTSRQ